MPTSYLKIFITQIVRNKLLALINITGLAAGLASCILIALFVVHELRYDAFFRNADDIHRLSFQVALPDNTISTSSVPGPVGPLLQEASSQVRTTTRLEKRAVPLQAGEQSLREEYFNLVDKNFFSVFDVDWLHGSAAQAFTSPNAVVLTESTARQYFATPDPRGSTLLMDDDVVLTVTGIIADLPSNTHLTGSAFASLDLLELLIDDPAAYLNAWWGSSFYTYVVLAPEARRAELEAQLADLFEKYAEMPPWLPPGTTISFGTIPLTDIHMQSRNIDELQPGGSLVLVYAFSAIGFGILAIAGVNFVNITTAWASRRAREVGIRKVLGATRRQLALQFIVEALLMCGLAMVLALAAVELLLPTLNALLATDLQLGLGSRHTAGLLVLATLGLGLLAGWYPSLYLSAFRPSAVMKGAVPASQKGVVLRGVLVVFQFTVVIVLMVAAAVIQLQLRHADQIDLGFRSGNVIAINTYGADFGNQYTAFRDMLLQSAAVTEVTSSDASPLRDANQSMSTFQGEGDSIPRLLSTMSVGTNYFDTYAIRLLAGRLFSAEFPADFLSGGGVGFAAGGVLINESVVREFGWTAASAIGRRLQSSTDISYTVVGVVTDTIENARLAAQPIVYFTPENTMAGEVISVGVADGAAAEVLEHINTSWKALGPGEPIRLAFIDDTIAGLYLQDVRRFQLSVFFSVLAIVIACMGLYGLVAFSTECRTKEIGVRKVMGGTIWSIVVLFTHELSRLVLLSNLIAWPVAYYAMNKWLASFAYRIDLTPLVFIGSGLIALCIAWVTVGGTAAKAASAKPVLALRYE